jgi:3-hydroxyisobutyrate dehydrogenase-like beta-hydroxyacid dehydrogenase
MRFGLVGLGEAGSAMCLSLVTVHGVEVHGYDPRLSDAAERSRVGALVGSGVTLWGSTKQLVQHADTVMSLVTPMAAPAVAIEARRWLDANHTFIDANSISPARAREIAEDFAGSRCRFVDVAIMAAVPPHGHAVPMLASGKEASNVATQLNRLGFRIEPVGDTPGMASAAKMIRSIIVKGTEALLLEALGAAAHLGVSDTVLASLDSSFPAGTWREKADYFASRTGRHAERRAAELIDVVETVAASGVEPIMTEAAQVRLRKAAATLAALPVRERDLGFEELVAVLGGRQSDAAG